MKVSTLREIVVLRGGAMGDCLVTFPSLRLLRERYPDSRITIVGSPYSGPIFGASPYHDRILMLFHRKNNIRYFKELLKLRKEKFDLLVDFQDAGRSRFQTAIIGGKQRIGFDTRRSLAKILYTDVIHLDKTVHVTRRLANLLIPLRVNPTSEELRADFDLAASCRQRADKLLQEHEIRGPFAMLQVTTGKRQEYRIWPPERFARVAEHLYALGYQVVVSSATESDVVRDLIEGARCPIHNLSNATEALVLAAVISRAKLYVGYNTGPMHLAASLGTPIVALFDVPSDMFEWVPTTDAPYRLVQAKTVAEYPGWRMDTIETGEVIEAIAEVVPQIQHAEPAEIISQSLRAV